MKWHHLKCWLLLTAASYCNCLPTAVKNLEAGSAHLAGTFNCQLRSWAFCYRKERDLELRLQPGMGAETERSLRRELALDIIVAFHRGNNPDFL